MKKNVRNGARFLLLGVGPAMMCFACFSRYGDSGIFALGAALNILIATAILLLGRPYTTPFVKQAFYWWLGSAALVSLGIFPILSIPEIMLRSAPVVLPIIVLCAAATESSRFSGLAHSVPCGVIFILGLFLPFCLPLSISKAAQKEEPIKLTDDVLADKTPAFVDEPTRWKALVPTADLPSGLEINKSGAVVALDLATIEGAERGHGEQRFTDYASALRYAESAGLSWMPSVQLVDQKAKVVADEIKASVERYTQGHATALGRGRQEFLEDLLAVLLEAGDEEAATYVAVPVMLGGGTPALPDMVAAGAAELQQWFLANRLASKPIGYYTDTPELERVFQQSRFCQWNFRSVYQHDWDMQTRIAARISERLGMVFSTHPELSREYEGFLGLQSRLCNPPDADFFPMGKNVPIDRGIEAHSTLFPPAGSPENTLFRRLYALQTLPDENVMNRLIRGIQSGEVDLRPDEDSGWYDYQLYALETLLLPDRGQEGEKLLLSRAYKERLLEAFRTMVTKWRELHVGSLHIADKFAAPLDVTLSPDLAVEPAATYYLRSARAFRFIENTLRDLLGDSALQAIVLNDGTPLADALIDISGLLYGLYLQVCDDIGMAPEFQPDELTEEALAVARTNAIAWLKTCVADGDLAQDGRYIVPILTDGGHANVRYWMCTGIRFEKLTATYARPPKVRMGNDANGVGYIDVVPRDSWIPVQEFMEVDGPNIPYTREAFRALCDEAGGQERIAWAVRLGRMPRFYEQSGVQLGGVILVFLCLAGGIGWAARRRPERPVGGA